ncbi:hypothetical protein [Pseudomonas viridiflava]|uniref:hypothetical protein n=1 Tax=Pseudomonas viridiflava TaxID=33069 RepID=UPI002EB990B9|nr:hypothetical protein [Pseudomonas viridiflava]
MTTNVIIRKSDKEEVQSLIDYEMQAYILTVQGRDGYIDAKSGRQQAGEFNRYGAIEAVSATSAPALLSQVQEKLDQGYKLYTGALYLPYVTPTFLKLYVVKSEAFQAEDAKAIAKEVEAKYQADIDAHNDRVFAQEAEALKAEEGAIAAQLREEDRQRAEAEFDRRVRERVRGSRAGAK